MSGGKAALVLCGVVAAGALLDLQVALRGDLTPVSAEDMARAKARLLALRQPGDVVVHSPLFTVRELQGLGDLPARPDRPSPAVMATRRVLVLDRTEAELFGLGQPEAEEALGPHLVLKTYAPAGGGTLAVFDLLTQLDSGMMSVERPVGRRSSVCTQPRPEGGWSCPGEAEWLYAAPRTLRIDGQDAQCVWAHPTTGGAVVFTLPDPGAPPAGRSLHLELQGGMTDDAVTGTADGAAVYIDVEQAGGRLGRLEVPNRVGWHRLKVPVGEGQVTLRITTPRDGRRHHCVNARIIEEGAK